MRSCSITTGHRAPPFLLTFERTCRQNGPLEGREESGVPKKDLLQGTLDLLV